MYGYLRRLNLEEKQKKYIIIKTIGKGSFGKVKEALHVQSGEKIAIKILDKTRLTNENDITRVKREISILSKVDHPNIIKLYEVFNMINQEC